MDGQKDSLVRPVKYGIISVSSLFSYTCIMNLHIMQNAGCAFENPLSFVNFPTFVKEIPAANFETLLTQQIN